MQEHVLEVGQELVIEGGIRLTLLAVEAGDVLLAITAPEPSDVAGPQAGSRPSSSTQGRSAPPTSLPWEGRKGSVELTTPCPSEDRAVGSPLGGGAG